ncbi:MAG: hypothetical protein Q7U34_12370 [Anaerolineales bacterium]|nr:hypothetical protein [Anaerolineales bacterium]
MPVALTGTEDRGVIDNLKHFRRSRITAMAGKPFYIEIPSGSGATILTHILKKE